MRPLTVWRSLFWLTFGAFFLTAGLNMAHISAGFATNHLADLAGPAWLYIVFRGLATLQRRTQFGRVLGATPARAALILFAGSTITEVSQYYWPIGLFPGRFDPLDILTYACGLLPLYLLDRWLAQSPTST